MHKYNRCACRKIYEPSAMYNYGGRENFRCEQQVKNKWTTRVARSQVRLACRNKVYENETRNIAIRNWKGHHMALMPQCKHGDPVGLSKWASTTTGCKISQNEAAHIDKWKGNGKSSWKLCGKRWLNRFSDIAEGGMWPWLKCVWVTGKYKKLTGLAWEIQGVVAEKIPSADIKTGEINIQKRHTMEYQQCESICNLNSQFKTQASHRGSHQLKKSCTIWA